MASYTKGITKDGKTYFTIRVSRGRGKTAYSERWYPSPEWSSRTVDRKLAAACADFEQRCKNGEVLNRKEKKDAAIEAERLAAEKAAKISTLQQFTEKEWFPAKKLSCADSTLAQYERMLRVHVFPVLGSLVLESITAAQIQGLVNSFSAEHSHKTTADLFVLLKNIFSEAFRLCAIEINPMLRVSLPARRKDDAKENELQSLDAMQVTELLHAADKLTTVWRSLILFLVDSGARVGEGLALRWDAIDWKESTVTISATLQRTKTGEAPKTTATKTGRSRTVDLGMEVLDLLKEWRAEQTADAGFCQFVFTEPGTNTPIRYDAVLYTLRRLGNEIGIEGLHPHILRHTCASLALTAGADIVSVSRRLGHATPQTTLNIYAHSSMSAVRAAGDKLRTVLTDARKEQTQNTDTNNA